MESNPLISVIIPVYNCERYLAEAIESVLAQSYKPVEVIVIDDGSTDGSGRVAKEFFPVVQYYCRHNSGAAAARNYGVAMSNGDFLSFLDADDIWTAGKLALQMAVFEDDPDVDFVFGYVQQFLSPELDEERKGKIRCPDRDMPGYVAGTMLIRKESFLRAGPFETDWRVGEFIDWYIRAREKRFISLLIPEVVTKRRLHETNMTARERDSKSDYLKILKSSLDRRRASGQIRDNTSKK